MTFNLSGQLSRVALVSLEGEGRAVDGSTTTLGDRTEPGLLSVSGPDDLLTYLATRENSPALV